MPDITSRPRIGCCRRRAKTRGKFGPRSTAPRTAGPMPSGSFPAIAARRAPRRPFRNPCLCRRHRYLPASVPPRIRDTNWFRECLLSELIGLEGVMSFTSQSDVEYNYALSLSLCARMHALRFTRSSISWLAETDGRGSAFQQASSGVFILTPGSTMPPRFPISVPPYRSAKAGGNGRPFGGQSQRRSRCRLRSGSGQSS